MSTRVSCCVFVLCAHELHPLHETHPIIYDITFKVNYLIDNIIDLETIDDYYSLR